MNISFKEIIVKTALFLLLTSYVSYGMQTAISYEKKGCYVDYILIQRFFAEKEHEIQVPFPCLKKTKEQAVAGLNKSSVEDKKLAAFGPIKKIVSLLRIYNDPKESEHVQSLYNNKEPIKIIEQELLNLGAEQGKWTIAEAIEKIKKHGGSKL